MKKYILVEKKEILSPDQTHLHLDISYIKGLWVVLFLQEWIYKNEWVYTSFTYDVFLGKRKKIILQEMKRKNQKVIDSIINDFKDLDDDYFINLLNA